MIDIKIKTLGPRDLLLFRNMMKLFDRVFDDADDYRVNIPKDSYVQKCLLNENLILLCAMHNDIVTGALTAYVLDKYEQNRQEIYIYDLAVEQKYRRRGIGFKLLNTLKLMALEMGINIVYIQTEIDNIPAIKLYEKFAQIEQIAHFEIYIK